MTVHKLLFRTVMLDTSPEQTRLEMEQTAMFRVRYTEEPNGWFGDAYYDEWPLEKKREMCSSWSSLRGSREAGPYADYRIEHSDGTVENYLSPHQKLALSGS